MFQRFLTAQALCQNKRDKLIQNKEKRLSGKIFWQWMSV